MMTKTNEIPLVEPCPSEDWTCPYYENGECQMMLQENKNPHEECDEFYGLD